MPRSEGFRKFIAEYIFLGKGGRKFAITKAQVAIGKKETVVGDLCKELGITRPTIYRYVGPDGKIREYGKRVLGSYSFRFSPSSNCAISSTGLS
jgi:hypothetical protein